jgi:selenocysteine-specific translation elongation factor
MPNLTVAVLAPPGYAKDLGKAGTTSDITFYNVKKGATTVTLVEPTRYPEKLSSLFFSVSLADTVILVVDEVNAQFGECVLMLQCAGKTRGRIVLRNSITFDQVAPLIQGTVLETYEVTGEDTAGLRERLFKEADRMAFRENPPSSGSGGAVPVDHAYNVKGVGTVMLGCISRGMIKRHDTLRVLPTDKTAQVRSIQKHDDDTDAAFPGDRVGLALKNIGAEEIDRGYVLSNDPSLQCSDSITAKAALVKYWPAPMKEGMVLSIGHWMQFLPCRITNVETVSDWRMPTLTLTLDTKLVFPQKSRAVLHYLEGGKLRVAGTLKLP